MEISKEKEKYITEYLEKKEHIRQFYKDLKDRKHIYDTYQNILNLEKL